MKVNFWNTLLILSCFFGQRLYGFGVENKLGTTIKEGIKVITNQNDTLDFKGLITKTTIVSMVKYDCDNYCPKMLKGVAKLIDDMQRFPQVDYQVVTLVYNNNINAAQTAVLQSEYKQMLDSVNTDLFGRWTFLTCDEDNIQKLTDNLGYQFYQNNNDYIHFSLLSVLDPGAMLVNYMYGYRFLPVDFNITYQYAIKGQTRPTVSRNLKYCNNYRAPAHAELHKIATTSAIIIIFAALVLFFALVFTKKRMLR